jgi:hypothetical protein
LHHIADPPTGIGNQTVLSAANMDQGKQDWNHVFLISIYYTHISKSDILEGRNEGRFAYFDVSFVAQKSVA